MTKKFGNFRRLIDRWCVQVSLHLTTKIQMFEFSWKKFSLHHKNQIFNIYLQNQIMEAIQLSKPNKFVPLGWFQRCFCIFVKIKNI